MRETPLVTVVIASRNYGRYIGEALQSVVAQDYRPLSIVVVDDGSDDGTRDIVKLHMNGASGGEPVRQYEPWWCVGAIKDVQVTTYSFSTSRGPAFARNYGIKKTMQDTDIFGILDADDVWKPGRVTKAVAKFKQNPEIIGMVYTDYDTHHEGKGLTIREFKEPYSREALLKSCICTNACFFSKLALKTVGLYDEEMRVCEDYDLFVRLSERFLICHIAEALVQVRVHPKNTTNTVPNEVWRQNWSRVKEKAAMRARGVR